MLPDEARVSVHASGIGERDFAVVGDVDNDGVKDIAVASGNATVEVFLGGSNHEAARISLPLAGPAKGVAVVDVDEDGLNDILAVSLDGLDATLYRALGHAGFDGPLQFPVTSVARSIALVDVNGDGDPQVVSIDDDTAGITLMGDLGETELARVPFANGGAAGMTFADMNNDGIDDMILIDRQGSETLVLHGDGAGGFSEQIPFTINPAKAGYTVTVAETGYPLIPHTLSPQPAIIAPVPESFSPGPMTVQPVSGTGLDGLND